MPKLRRDISAMLLGSIWLVNLGFLWVWPSGNYRRSVTFEEFGCFKALVRITSYRSQPGKALGYEIGEGFWLTVVLTCLITVSAIVSYVWLTKRRHRPGYCAVCNYDLRGTLSSTCPECGTKVTRVN